MKPATCFAPSRFLRLLRAQWAEQRRAYGLFLLVVFATQALLMLIMLAMEHGRAGQTGTQAFFFWLGLLVSGMVFASQYFAALRRPESALLLLTRPASTCEKWLLAALTVLVAYPLAYTLCITLVNAAAGAVGYQWDLARATELLPEGITHSALPEPRDYALFVPFATYQDSSLQAPASQWAWLLVLAGLSGFAVLGSIYFRKLAGLKTAVVCFVVFLLTVLLSSTLGFHLEHLAWWLVLSGEASAPSLLWWLVNALFWLGVPALLWLCALLALRERDLA
ncbi:MAG: hypothetical protein Q4G39_05805 [Brachymonas sp.]|nr:hypothetical protein [Brachymonas sp.]